MCCVHKPCCCRRLFLDYSVGGVLNRSLSVFTVTAVCWFNTQETSIFGSFTSTHDVHNVITCDLMWSWQIFAYYQTPKYTDWGIKMQLKHVLNVKYNRVTLKEPQSKLGFSTCVYFCPLVLLYRWTLHDRFIIIPYSSTLKATVLLHGPGGSVWRWISCCFLCGVRSVSL